MRDLVITRGEKGVNCCAINFDERDQERYVSADQWRSNASG